MAKGIASNSEAREGRQTLNGARQTSGAFVERGGAGLAQTGNHPARQVAQADEGVLPQHRWGSQGHSGHEGRGETCQQTFHKEAAVALAGALGRVESAGMARTTQTRPQHLGRAGAWAMQGMGPQGGTHRSMNSIPG